MESERVGAVLDTLASLYPDAAPELDFSNPFETVIATILSAQCTDKQVNRVTAVLFKRCPDVYAMDAMEHAELEDIIRPCGFYATKTKHLKGTCRRLIEAYGGQVPGSMEELLTLPGVGRKVANVVLANAFGADAIAVDTHVFRVANRLGLADAKDVLKTEYQLMERIPKERWSHAHHLLIFHGRRCCDAKKPRCEACAVSGDCGMYNEAKKPPSKAVPKRVRRGVVSKANITG